MSSLPSTHFIPVDAAPGPLCFGTYRGNTIANLVWRCRQKRRNLQSPKRSARTGGSHAHTGLLNQSLTQFTQSINQSINLHSFTHCSICTNVINKEEEVIQEEVTIVSCIVPVLLVALYVIFLVLMHQVLTHLPTHSLAATDSFTFLQYLWLDSKIDPETDSYTRIHTIFECLIGKRNDISEFSGYNDPFKRVWISGPIISSILYILMVRNYERYMAKVLTC